MVAEQIQVIEENEVLDNVVSKIIILSVHQGISAENERLSSQVNSQNLTKIAILIKMYFTRLRHCNKKTLC